jgi:hypothetical protein
MCAPVPARVLFDLCYAEVKLSEERRLFRIALGVVFVTMALEDRNLSVRGGPTINEAVTETDIGCDPVRGFMNHAGKEEE